MDSGGSIFPWPKPQAELKIESDEESLKNVVSLGGMCWVARLCQSLRHCPHGPFDYMGTTPAMVADIIQDDFQKLLDVNLLIQKPHDDRNQNVEPHFDHMHYSLLESVPPEILTFAKGVLNAHCLSIPAIFQHDTTGGAQMLVTTMRRRVNRMRTLLEGSAWKVLVWGVAVPYNVHCDLQRFGFSAHVLDLLRKQLKTLYEALRNAGVEKFVLVGLIVVHGVPCDVDCKFPCRPAVLSEYNSGNQTVLTHQVEVHSTLRGARFSGASAQDDLKNLGDLLRDLIHQKGWERFRSDVYCREYLANRSLQLTSWNDPRDTWSLGILQSILVHSAYDEWQLQFSQGGDMPLVYPVIVSDSTLLQYDETALGVLDAGHPLACIVGVHGGSFSDGGMQHASRIAIDAAVRMQQTGNPLIAYVPAGDCHPRHEYPKHERKQNHLFQGNFFLHPTPSLKSFGLIYEQTYGQQMFKATGVHLTKPGRTWLAWALSTWARHVGANWILCVGWTAQEPHLEYNEQLSLVSQILES
jgi:hypothetical protein